MNAPTVIGVLGGSGEEGSGLAFRWARHGHDVVIGSRTLEKAVGAAEKINALLGGSARVRAATNLDAAREGEIIVLTVPYSAQRTTAESVQRELEGKILIDVTVPLAPPVDRVQLPGGESAVLALQRTLGEGVRVVSAFQNVSATHLKQPDHAIECDVLVCGDDRAARERTIELAHDAGLRAFHAGVLANSAAAEALTSVLIAINKHYKVRGAGVRLTGVPRDERR